MKRLAIGSLLAGVAVFAWGFLFWGALPMAENSFVSTDNYEEIGATLNELLPEDGKYYVPWVNGITQEEMARLHEAGPIATIHFRRAGATAGGPGVMIRGFLLGLVVSFVFGLFMHKYMPGTSPNQKLMAMLFIGLAATLWTDLADTIWWYQPASSHLINAIYNLGSFAAIGAVLARFTGEPEAEAVA